MPTRPEDRKAGLRLKNGRVVSDKRSRAAKPKKAAPKKVEQAPSRLPKTAAERVQIRRNRTNLKDKAKGGKRLDRGERRFLKRFPTPVNITPLLGPREFGTKGARLPAQRVSLTYSGKSIGKGVEGLHGRERASVVGPAIHGYNVRQRADVRDTKRDIRQQRRAFLDRIGKEMGTSGLPLDQKSVRALLKTDPYGNFLRTKLQRDLEKKLGFKPGTSRMSRASNKVGGWIGKGLDAPIPTHRGAWGDNKVERTIIKAAGLDTVGGALTWLVPGGAAVKVGRGVRIAARAAAAETGAPVTRAAVTLGRERIGQRITRNFARKRVLAAGIAHPIQTAARGRALSRGAKVRYAFKAGRTGVRTGAKGSVLAAGAPAVVGLQGATDPLKGKGLFLEAVSRPAKGTSLGATIGNSIKDIVGLPAAMIPSVALFGAGVVQLATSNGKDTRQLQMLWDGWKETSALGGFVEGQSFGEFIRKVQQHPVYFALEVLGPVGAARAAARGAARSGSLGREAQLRALDRDVSLEAGSGVEGQQYKLRTRGPRQKRRLEEGIRLIEQDTAADAAPLTLRQHVKATRAAGRVARRWDRVEDFDAGRLRVARAEHDALATEAGRLLEKEVGRDAVPVTLLVGQRIIKPEAMTADLAKVLSQYLEAHASLRGDAKLANEAITASIQSIKGDIAAEARVLDAAQKLVESEVPISGMQIERDIITLGRERAARAQPEQVMHEGAEHVSKEAIKEGHEEQLAPFEDAIKDARATETKAAAAAREAGVQLRLARARRGVRLTRTLKGRRQRAAADLRVKGRARRAYKAKQRAQRTKDRRLAAEKARDQERTKLYTTDKQARRYGRMERPVVNRDSEVPGEYVPPTPTPSPPRAAPTPDLFTGTRPTVVDALDAGGQTWQPGHVQRGVIGTAEDGTTTVYTWDAQGDGSVHADFRPEALKRGVGAGPDLDIGPDGTVYIRGPVSRTAATGEEAAGYTKAIESANPDFKVAGVEAGDSMNPVRDLIDKADNGSPPIAPEGAGEAVRQSPPSGAGKFHAENIAAKLSDDDLVAQNARPVAAGIDPVDFYGFDGPEVPPLRAEAGATERLPPGDTETMFLSHRPRELRSGAGRPQTVTRGGVQAPGLPEGHRTGASVRAGSSPADVIQHVQTKREQYRRILDYDDAKAFQERAFYMGKDGQGFESQADALKFLGSADPEAGAMRARAAGGKVVAVRRDFFDDARLAADNAVDGRFDLDTINTINNGVWTRATEPKDGARWALVSERQLNRAAQHRAGLNNPLVQTMSEFNRRFKAAVLPWSPNWYLGNAVDTSMRAIINGQLPPGLARVQPNYRLGKTILGADTGPINARQGLASGLQFGEEASRHLGGFERRIERAIRPHANVYLRALQDLRSRPAKPNAVIDLAASSTDILFKFNTKFIESDVVVAAVGKAARREIQDINLRMGRAKNDMVAGMEDFLKGLRDTPAQAAFAERIHDVFGNWIGASPKARTAIALGAPFYMWLRAATRFVYSTMPRNHPVITGLVSMAASATEQERDALGLDLFTDLDPKRAGLQGDLPGYRQGSIPIGDGRLLPVARLQSFGVLASGPMALGSFLFPILMPIIDAKTVTDWKGDKLKEKDGSPATLETQAGAMGLSFMETFIPAAIIVEKFATKGGGRDANRFYGTPFWKGGGTTRTKTAFNALLPPSKIVSDKQRKKAISMNDGRRKSREGRGGGGGLGGGGL